MRRRFKVYGIEQHMGGARDVGVIIQTFKFKDEAVEEAAILRKKDKRHGYRVVTQSNFWKGEY